MTSAYRQMAILGALTRSTSTRVFDPQDKKYRICCRSLHILVAARLLAILSAVLLFAHFVNTLRSFGGYNSFHNWTLLLSGSVIFGTFLYGAFYEDKYFLVPFIFSQLLLLLVLIISLSLTASTLLMSTIYANQGYKFSDEERSDYVVAMSFMSILALIEIWFVTVGCKAFQYIRDRDASLEEPTAMPVGDFVIDKAVI